MVDKPRPIPEGYASVTPYLIVADADAAIAFYKRAFGAEEVMRLPMPNGRIAHAEIRIGTSRVMLGEAPPESGPRDPGAARPIFLYLYVEDVDATYAAALAAGATAGQPPENQIYGDRSGSVTDPFGHLWYVATHIEDVSRQEILRRTAEKIGE